MKYEVEAVCLGIADSAAVFISEMTEGVSETENTGESELLASTMDVLESGKPVGRIVIRIPSVVAETVCRKFLGVHGEIRSQLIVSAVNEILNIVVGRTMEFLRANLPGMVIGLPKSLDIGEQIGYDNSEMTVTVTIGDDIFETQVEHPEGPLEA